VTIMYSKGSKLYHSINLHQLIKRSPIAFNDFHALHVPYSLTGAHSVTCGADFCFPGLHLLYLQHESTECLTLMCFWKVPVQISI